MKLTIEHVGKVAKGTITLSGITAVAGPNKSGKSTIGRTLMTLGTLLRRMDELVRTRKLRVFLSKVGESIGITELSEIRFRRLVDSDYQADDLLSPGFWTNKETTDALFSKLARTMSPIRARSFRKQIEELGDDEIPKILQDILNQDETEIMCDIVDEQFRTVFSGQINSLCRPATEAYVGVSLRADATDDYWVSFKDGSLHGHGEQLSAAFPATFYLEPLHFLDFLPVADRFPLFTDRYRAGDCAWRKVLRANPAGDEDLSLEEKRQLEELLGEIKTILGGELGFRDGHLQFREESLSSQGEWLELDNIASGMKSMSMLCQALKNRSLRRGSLLIIDEPESNLHPEWQIRFAAVLVRLWKRLGLRVLVATHSPYFLKGLEMASAHQGCLEDFSSYLMKPDDAAGGSIAVAVTGRLNEIYKVFYDPLNNLMA